jgi:hypothetical protein
MALLLFRRRRTVEDHTDMTDYRDDDAEEHTPEEAEPASWHTTQDDQATIEEEGYGYGV